MIKQTFRCLGAKSSTGKGLLVSLFFLLFCLVAHSECTQASGSPSFSGQSPSQQQVSQPQSTATISALEAGKPIEREISGWQVQGYELNLSADQFVSITVLQRGVDVIEKVYLPDGKLVAQFDSELRPQEDETAEFVAETSGVYRLEIKAKFKGALGRYEIRVAGIRSATERDRSLHDAHRLGTQSNILFRTGKYDQALLLGERALESAEKAVGTESVIVAYLLNRLGMMQRTIGETDKAEVSLQRALAIDEKTLGLEHPQTVEALGRLGLVYESKSDYAKAGRLLQQALETTERTLGTEHPSVAAALVNLSALHLNLADLEQAERELQRALAISEKTLEPDDRTVTQALNNLGNVYLSKKDYPRSETFLLRAIAIYEKSFGAEHPFLIAPLLNLGRLSREKKDYARALSMYQRALAIGEKTFGADHIEVAPILNNIANIYKVKGDYAEALKLHLRVLKVAENSAGTYDYLTILSLGNIANLYAAQGDLANAITFQTRVDQRLEAVLALNLAIGSERQKVAYFNSLAERTDRTISFHLTLAQNDKTAGALAALVLLQRKGRIVDSMSDSLTALRERSDPDDQKLLDQLNSATAQLAKLALNRPQQMAIDDYQKRIRTLEEQKEKLEAAISRRSAEFRAQSQTVTLSAVQAAIPANAALMEFAIYRPYNPRAENNNEAYGKPHYAVFVMRRQGDLQWKDLGEKPVIDAAVGELRQALRDPMRNDVRQLARAVDEKILKPVRAVVGDAKQLLISPDGELNLIPFEVLVDEQGRYLVQSHNVSYLTSGRDLLRLQVRRQIKSPPMVVADPAFGEPAVIASREEAGPGADARGRAQLDYSQIFFAPLPGAAGEVRALRQLLPQATFLTKEQATKAALMRVNGPSVLHIATHGFFLQSNRPVARQATTETKDPTRLGKWVAHVENPLLRSGLALAGANRSRNGDEDGVLTAFEATGLDLWGTRLVVLSACDTGIGEVKNGDGVYGLRRAFVLAGAESLIMSLWPVSDLSTRSLMIGYYKGLVENMGRSEALRRVQLEMLQSKSRSHPYYWASFIETGEWASLDGKRR